jgi:hypothetical protein
MLLDGFNAHLIYDEEELLGFVRAFAIQTFNPHCKLSARLAPIEED